MAKNAKRIGNAFEYRVADWFDQQPNWFGLRNPLSGASEQIKTAVSKHDVRAWNEKLNIFLQIECKKRSKNSKDPKKSDSLEIKKEWIDKLDFENDELLVFATNRSPIYVFIPSSRFFRILGRSFEIEYSKENTFKGEKQFVLYRELVDRLEDKRFHLLWNQQPWTILLLDDFLVLRETAKIEQTLSVEEQIKRFTNLESALNFESENISTLNYKQKSLLYSKIHQLDSDGFINPVIHAESQFWLDDAFILVCPHCSKKVTKKDLDSN